MSFHPVAQEVTRALKARRRPPPPVVPTMHIDLVRRFAHKVLRHPSRRDIAEGLLVIAMRLDVLGFYKPRDQLLFLAGCGLSAGEITDSLERKGAARAGAHQLMEKARSISATQMERMLAEKSKSISSGVGLRSRQRLQRSSAQGSNSSRTRTSASSAPTESARTPAATRGRRGNAESAGPPGRREGSNVPRPSRRGPRKPSGPSGRGGSGPRE